MSPNSDIVGIIPGLYGMENSQKVEMGKNWNTTPRRNKTPSWTRAKNGPKNGNPLEIHFRTMFSTCPARGCSPFGFPFFPHFRHLAVFHAIQALHDPKGVVKTAIPRCQPHRTSPMAETSKTPCPSEVIV